MNFTSINQLKKELGLKSDDIESIREELNLMRIELHPDKTNGNFINESDKIKYHQIDEAISFIEGIKDNNQLIVVDKITDLIKVVAELIPNNKTVSLQNNVETKINFAIQNFKTKFFIPKISLTSITAILTFFIAFPGQIKDNPILYKYVDLQNPIFIILWVYMILSTGLFWIITYMNEQKGKYKLSLLKVDSTQNLLFDSFLKSLEKEYFTKDELTMYIFHRYSRKNSLLLFINLLNIETVTLEIAQSISELIISKAEKNIIIENITVKSLSETYKIKNYA